MTGVSVAQAEADIATAARVEIEAQWRAACQRERAALDALSKAKMAEAPPVDRRNVTLTDGTPVTEDHRELKPNGQQKGYVVLSDIERAKGFSRPYRDAYRHTKCGRVTTMNRALSETYARDPYFYSGTYCCGCGAHFPVGPNGEFVWLEMDGREIDKVGT